MYAHNKQNVSTQLARNFRNAFVVCAAYHRNFTDNPNIQQIRYFYLGSGIYDQMYQRSRDSSIGKAVDWDEERIRL